MMSSACSFVSVSITITFPSFGRLTVSYGHLHHYVVQTTYKKDDEDAVLDGMPEAFEACFDNENGKTGECEDVSMFYLEDCSVTDAATIVSWLKANKNWKTYVAD